MERFLKSYIQQYLLLAALLFGVVMDAKSMDYRGEVSLEGRIFEGDSNFNTDDHNLSVFARFETSIKRSPWRLKLRASARVDAKDEQRSLFNPEEIWAGFRKNGWDIRFGTQMLDWTATEAFHPADTFNSRIWDSNIENADKIGEVALSVATNIERGELSFYYMPRYEEPIFPGESSRLNPFGGGVAVSDAVWIDRNGHVSGSAGNQWGMRITQSISGADFGVHYLSHQDRYHPVIIQTMQNEYVPVYLPVDEVGLTYQQVFGGVIAKLEYSKKHFDNTSSLVDIPKVEGARALSQLNHGQLALGLEYGWSLKNGSEMTLYLEGQRILGVDEAEAVMLSQFQNDIMFGYRYALNDIKGRELFLSMIVDREIVQERLYNLRFQQRISDTVTSICGLRFIQASSDSGSRDGGLRNLDGSNQVFIMLIRYF